MEININGKSITCSGNNISICNGAIIVDGKTIQEVNNNNVQVVIKGNVNKIDCSGSVEVYGDSGDIDCGGSCGVNGNVKGNITAGGSVNCGNTEGNISAGGNVRYCR